MKNGSCFRERGFTLIEILVVMGLIVLLLGGVSAALRRPADVAIRTAQFEVAGLVASAQAGAASRQGAVRLVVAAMPDEPDRFMRVLQVFHHDWASGVWKPSSPAIWLPKGIWIAPPLSLSGLIVGWAGYSGPRSTLLADTAAALEGEEFSRGSRIGYLDFASDGSVSVADEGAEIVLVAPQGPGGPPGNGGQTATRLRINKRGAITFER